MNLEADVDATVVVPPLSPSDTNPPLGPYLLKARLESAGLAMNVIDLSVQYISQFKRANRSGSEVVIGDQNKDRRATHAARDHFIANCPLLGRPVLHVPCCSDAVLGMHYSFRQIDCAVETACEQGGYWRALIDKHVFDRFIAPPRVMGLSLMGPPQVFVGLVIARLAKRRWPETLVVAGGSHVTLLAQEIARDGRYGGDIDLFMPGHCEREFVQVVDLARRGMNPKQLGIVAGGWQPRSACGGQTVQVTMSKVSRRATADFGVLPALTREDLSSYDTANATLPLQLTRGCSYGRCTYCTYPSVEPLTNVVPDWPRAMSAIRHLVERTGVRRVSFKDSLFTPKNLRELADQLRMHDILIEWSATTLLHERLTPGLLNDMAAAGCRTLEVGLESTDPVGQALFDKRLDLGMVHNVIDGAANAGIVMVLNQIFGWPGQTLESAEQQLAWYACTRKRWPRLIRASCNMLEINRASPMARDPEKFGIEVLGVAPWAFSYEWAAPSWRPAMAAVLRHADHEVGDGIW